MAKTLPKSYRYCDVLIAALAWAVFPILAIVYLLERHLFAEVHWGYALGGLAIVAILVPFSHYLPFLQDAKPHSIWRWSRFIAASLLIAFVAFSLQAHLRPWRKRYFGTVILCLLLSTTVSGAIIGYRLINSPAAREAMAELAITADTTPLADAYQEHVQAVLRRFRAQPQLAADRPDAVQLAQALEKIYGKDTQSLPLVERLELALEVLTPEQMPASSELDRRLSVLFKARLQLMRAQLARPKSSSNHLMESQAANPRSGALAATALLERVYPGRIKMVLASTGQVDLDQARTITSARGTFADAVDELELNVVAISISTLCKTNESSKPVPAVILDALGANDGKADPVDVNDGLAVKTRQLLSKAIVNYATNSASGLRAYNNLLDFEVWHLTSGSRNNPEHGQRPTNRETAPEGASGDGREQLLRSLIDRIQPRLGAEGGKEVFLTLAQAYALLAHADAQRYKHASQANKPAHLEKLSGDLDNCCTYLIAAKAVNWEPTDVFADRNSYDAIWLGWLETIDPQDQEMEQVVSRGLNDVRRIVYGKKPR